jgi:hypothetical protein
MQNNRMNQDLHLLGEQPSIKLKLKSSLYLMNLGNHCKKILNIKTTL